MRTVPEAARRLNRHPETVRRWIREGKLRSVKVGTQHLIDDADLAALDSRNPPGRGSSEPASIGDSVVETMNRGREERVRQIIEAVVPYLARGEVERLVADAALVVRVLGEHLAAGAVDPREEPPESRFAGMPGWELVSIGLADLAAARETVEALLVAGASERLGQIGLHVPGPPIDDATGRLYALVEAEVGAGQAHSRYNALRRRLASFLRSVDATAA